MKTLQLLFLFLILFSCKEIESEYEKQEKQRKILEEKKEVLTKKLNAEYEIPTSFDTLRLDFSYMYQELIEINPYQILNDYKVHDIYKSDSIYKVLLSTGYYPEFFFDMQLSIEQKELLENQMTDDFFSWYSSSRLPFVFVIKIKNISRIRFSTYPTGYEDDLSYELEVSDAYFCNAEIKEIETVK